SNAVSACNNSSRSLARLIKTDRMGRFPPWPNFDVSVSKKLRSPVLGHRFRTGVSGFACPCCWTVAARAWFIAELGFGCPRPAGPADLASELVNRNVGLAFARIRAFLRADLDRFGISAMRGEARVFATLHDAIDASECGLRLERSRGCKDAVLE